MSIVRQGSQRIQALVVDDSPTNLEFSWMNLTRMGMEVDKATSAREAIALSKQKRYDYIFMDLEMPEMNGYQATTIIRGGKFPSSNAFIIALTASVTRPDHVARCIQSGMNDCVTKPFQIDFLRDRLSKWETKRREEKAMNNAAENPKKDTKPDDLST